MRLIDADALFDDCVFSSEAFEKGMREFIGDAPTIEERKKGKWIWDDEGYHCSECFFHAYGNTLECLDGTYRYCPKCGAKMDEERREDEDNRC